MLLTAVLLLAASDDDAFLEVARPFVRDYCASCHGTEVQEGALTLTGYSGASSVRADPDVWGYVHERVELAEMPPRGAAMPSGAERETFLAWLADELAGSSDSTPIDPGRPVMRRLNNAQYENAIRDLFGVHFPARERFPSDGIGHGFDTVGESLTMPELRLEKLLTAAEIIAAEVFVAPVRSTAEHPDPAEPSAFQVELFERYGEELGQEREEAMLADLVRRLWRRPGTESELDRLGRLPGQGGILVERLRLQLSALLSSPNFIYLVESDPEGAEGVRALTAPEISARLAAFLWSSVPDRRLDALADAGDLTDPLVYEAVLHSMLEDERAGALGKDFALQWLGLRALDEVQPDPDRFPSWTESLAVSMREETEQVFMTILREGSSAWELLEADWTIVDSRLAAHYGLEVAEGVVGHRVSLAATPRRGVLGHAGVLTVTSDPTRTSPVKRGKWVLEALLAAPPPAPPPGADSLDEDPAVVGARSMRQRLEEHREQPRCAVCHDRMDPLGFGLEVFDAVGLHRERDGEFAIDASGVLPDGRRFDGPIELVGLLRQDQRFLRAVTEKLLVYALGRGAERGDRRQVETILAGLDPEHPSLADLVLGVARSQAFLSKRVEE